MIKLLRLFVPGLVVFVPLGIATVAAWPIIVADDLERTAAVLVVVWVLAWSVALAATVATAAHPAAPDRPGALERPSVAGRGVGPFAGLKVALKRFPGLLALVLVGGVAALVIFVAAVAVGKVSGNDWACYLTSTVLGLAALPMLLAVPEMVLAGQPAMRSIGAGYQRLLSAPWWAVPVLVTGVAVIPGGVGLLLHWTGLPITALATTPLAAVALTSIFTAPQPQPRTTRLPFSGRVEGSVAASAEE